MKAILKQFSHFGLVRLRRRSLFQPEATMFEACEKPRISLRLRQTQGTNVRLVCLVYRPHFQ